MSSWSARQWETYSYRDPSFNGVVSPTMQNGDRFPYAVLLYHEIYDGGLRAYRISGRLNDLSVGTNSLYIS